MRRRTVQSCNILWLFEADPLRGLISGYTANCSVIIAAWPRIEHDECSELDEDLKCFRQLTQGRCVYF
jgi:hypothetical protein